MDFCATDEINKAKERGDNTFQKNNGNVFYITYNKRIKNFDLSIFTDDGDTDFNAISEQELYQHLTKN
jgi:hypothetical protein